jgi:hypothetical protein
MNGEPRDDVSTSDLARAPVNSPIAKHQADLPVPSAVNTEGLTKTTMKDDATLAPLFTRDTATDFRARWDMVQKSFVDDPKKAVHAADELVAEVTESLADTFANQRSELERGLDPAGAPSTENLRIALRRYRSFFERLLSI